MSKSVNKVFLLGNLTRDPEMKQSEGKKPMCVFGLATNRGWTTETGEKREETEFHRIIAWDKKAETCYQYLKKGRKVHVEGRLQTRPYMTFQCSRSNEAAIESSTLRTIRGSNSLTGAKSMSGCRSVSWYKI